MSNIVNVVVPDIGDFKDIPIIEVLVKPGDTVKKETPLISLESDKAEKILPILDQWAAIIREVNG